MDQESEPRPPVWIEAKMKDNRILKFDCWTFDTSGPQWKFLEWSHRRGRKIMRLINAAEVANINIEAPEEMFSSPHAVAASPTRDADMSGSPVLQATQPREEINPFIAAKMRMVKENGALVAKKATDQFGRPRTEIVSDLRNGEVQVEVVDAGMI